MKKPPSTAPLIPFPAIMGVMTGISIAMANHFSHDHAGFSAAELQRHFVPELMAIITVCTILSVSTAVIWKRLNQQP